MDEMLCALLSEDVSLTRTTRSPALLLALLVVVAVAATVWVGWFDGARDPAATAVREQAQRGAAAHRSGPDLQPLAPASRAPAAPESAPASFLSSGPGRRWTITLRPFWQGTARPESIHARLESPRAFPRDWGERVTVGEDGSVRLGVDCGLESLRRCSLLLGSSATALQRTDGRVFTGDGKQHAAALLLDSGAANDEAHILDLGAVELAAPLHLGAVVPRGAIGNARIRLGVQFEAEGLDHAGAPRGASLELDQDADEIDCFTFFGLRHRAAVLSWGAQLSQNEGLDESSGEAPLGVDIHLDVPAPAGLHLTVDLAAFPLAGRLIVPADGAGEPTRLAPDAYRKRVTASRWSLVIPGTPRARREARFEIGKVRVPRGEQRLELWSLQGGSSERQLIWSQRVRVDSGFARISVP